MELITSISNLRKRLDALAHIVKDIRATGSSSQLSRCNKSLLYAKAWLGAMLGELGQETPYKNDGKRESHLDIEPTDAQAQTLGDLLDQVPADFFSLNRVQQIDLLRQELQKDIDYLTEFATPVIQASNLKRPRELSIARTNAYTHLREARFALGFALEQIRG